MSSDMLAQGLHAHFLWPSGLWLLASLPFLVALYVWLIARRRPMAMSFSALALVRDALGKTSWRRHVPPALMLGAFACISIAAARPTWDPRLLTREQTIVLAMDVSLSMRAKDVPPDRISASQSAARAFVLALPADVRIGVVSYAGIAQVVQPPTTSKEAVIEAIGRFQLQRGTAIGNGIAMSLATLFPDDGIDVSQLDMPRPLPHGRPPVEDRAAPRTAPSVAPGSYRSAAIVLLTDGQSFMGFDPMAAAQMAADRGVRVFTVGVGTRDGEVLDLGGWKMRVKLDEDTLMRISNLTVGKYFHAGSESDLGEIYKELGGRLVYERERMEITVLLAALAGVLMLTAASLSLWWYGRIA